MMNFDPVHSIVYTVICRYLCDPILCSLCSDSILRLTISNETKLNPSIFDHLHILSNECLLFFETHICEEIRIVSLHNGEE